MSDLIKLKNITENLTVLYVEDSAVLLTRMTAFLERIFKKVYQAENGKAGIESFKRDKPDIIITDLNMPVMGGHEMIKHIKEIDPNSNIIVVSAYSDTENLLESIHLGVVDFVPKPVDSALLQEVLLKVATKASQSVEDKVATHTTQNLQSDDEVLKKLNIVYKSHNQIEFINHYKGVPILNKGTIKSIDTKSITVEVPFFQTLAVKYEGKTVLDSELFDHSIEAKLERINGHDGTIKLTDLKYLNLATLKRRQLSVVPGESFSVVTKYREKILETKVQYLSIDFITLLIDNDELIFKEGDALHLEFEIKKTEEKHILKPIKIFTEGEVYIIDTNNSKEKIIMILFELEHHDKTILESYIEHRRSDLITEFKQLKQH